MKAAAFDYAVPKSVAEATALLGSNGAATAAIAGGQSLLPLLNLRVALPDLVVDLGRLEELKEIAATRTNIRIGALTTHAAIEDGKLPEAFGGLMQIFAGAFEFKLGNTFGMTAFLSYGAFWWWFAFLLLFAHNNWIGQIGCNATLAWSVGKAVIWDGAKDPRINKVGS